MSQGYLNQPYFVYNYMANLDQNLLHAQASLVLLGSKLVHAEADRLIVASKTVHSEATLDIQTTKLLHAEASRLIEDFEKLLRTQAERVIADQEALLRTQGSSVIQDRSFLHSEAARLIEDFENVLHTEATGGIGATDSVHAQTDRQITAEALLRAQASLQIQDFEQTMRAQVEFLIAALNQLPTQASAEITTTDALHAQAQSGDMLVVSCGGYFTGPYLNTPYMNDSGALCAFLPTQVDMKIMTINRLNSQASRQIVDHEQTLRTQAKGFVTVSQLLHSQVGFSAGFALRSQITLVNYNIDRLRVLYDFPSRGVDGLNWTASSTAPGMFSANNLNTDIVQQYWRSADGAISAVTLTCDTQVVQGIFTDTLGILGHNLTTSATVLWEASNAPDFSTIGFAQNLFVQPADDRIIWVSPTLPTEPFRYWRFTITDSSNPDGFLRIGTIVFGSASILTFNDMTDQVTRAQRHWSDKLYTEGFFNAQNDRALTRSIGVKFENLEYNSGNYQRLLAAFDFVRTDLKALWIPTPRFPYRFAVFAKLTEIPSEEHNVKGEDADYITMNASMDESL